MVQIRITVAALVAGVVITCAAASPSRADGAARVQPLLSRDPNTSYSFGGLTGEYISAIQERWLKEVVPHNPRLLTDIADRNKQPYRGLEPWAGEFAGKHLTGAVELYRITRDPGLKASIAEFVQKLVSLQAPNGYLGVFPDSCEFTGLQAVPEPPNSADEWGHYHIMLGLLHWYDETGDTKALDAARKMGDVICDHFLGKPGKLSKSCIREFDFSIAHGLALLYERTGERKYLDMSRQIIDGELAIEPAFDFVNRTLAGEEFGRPGGVRWECMHTIMALPELYWITGRKSYGKAAELMFWSMAKTDRHNNGGWGSMEGAFCNPYEVRAMELCCDIAWIAYGSQILELTGNPLVADELELSYFNFIQASQGRSGAVQSYNVPSDGVRTPSMPGQGEPNRPDNSEICCCSVNSPRGFGLISDWALLRDGDGLALNWYGPSKLTASAAGTRVTLEQKTGYPRTGGVTMKVTPEKPAEFTLKLRIPHWSRKTSVSVNGEPISGVRPGSYLAIKRLWAKGDTVSVNLDMSLRFWAGENEDAGRASIYRGPLLLALPRRAVKDALKLTGDWGIYHSARYLSYSELFGSRKAGDTVTREFEGTRVVWLYNPLEDCGRAEVRIDGELVDTVDLYGPWSTSALWAYDKTKPNLFLSARWERAGLKPGKHTIEIRVLGQKSAESKDVWVNVCDILSDSEDPILDARKLRARLVPTKDAPDAMAAMDVSDVNGHRIRLVDFDAAGEKMNPYISWLLMRNAPSAEFSLANPSRSAWLK